MTHLLLAMGLHLRVVCEPSDPVGEDSAVGESFWVREGDLCSPPLSALRPHPAQTVYAATVSKCTGRESVVLCLV